MVRPGRYENETTERRRLAIVTTHPIQYHAPWFRLLAKKTAFELKVFYLWEFGIRPLHDPGFGQVLQWDLPLLEGYNYEFIPNTSRKPGTDHFGGIKNAELGVRITEFGPDAALLIGYRYDSLMRVILTPKRCRGFPLLFRGDSHRLGREPRGLRSAVRRQIIASIYRRFAAVLYVGKANRDYFATHGVSPSRLFFAPHAVDNERFLENTETAAREAAAWRCELGIPRTHLVILFAGKFEEKKRPQDLLEAFRTPGESDISLLFVGSGHLEQELRQRAATIPNVFFAPFQNQTQMPRTYAACDLFVLPSFGPEESWGLAVNEAMCMGKPAVVSSHVGCGPDLVKPQVNGLVFPAGDVTALSTALREACSDRDRLRRWGEESRKMINQYSYAQMTDGLWSALKSLGWTNYPESPHANAPTQSS